MTYSILFSFLLIDGFKDLLAGQEYTQILSILSDHISILRIVDNLQKEYLTATKGYKETAPTDRNQGLMQSRRQKWFDDVSLNPESLSKNSQHVWETGGGGRGSKLATPRDMLLPFHNLRNKTMCNFFLCFLRFLQP